MLRLAAAAGLAFRALATSPSSSILRREGVAALVEVAASGGVPEEPMQPGTWCGAHRAKDCAACVADGVGMDWCNGDCEWSTDTMECLFSSELIWCGGHASPSCTQCVWDYVGSKGKGGETTEGGMKDSDRTKFLGPGYCNGECYWAVLNQGMDPHSSEAGACMAKFPHPQAANWDGRSPAAAAVAAVAKRAVEAARAAAKEGSAKMPTIAPTMMLPVEVERKVLAFGHIVEKDNTTDEPVNATEAELERLAGNYNGGGPETVAYQQVPAEFFESRERSFLIYDRDGASWDDLAAPRPGRASQILLCTAHDADSLLGLPSFSSRDPWEQRLAVFRFALCGVAVSFALFFLGMAYLLFFDGDDEHLRRRILAERHMAKVQSS